MTSISSAIHFVSNCPKNQKRTSHCVDLGEYMMEVINRQWLRQFGDRRYFEHSVFKSIVNLVNPNLTLFEQWELNHGQRFASSANHNFLMPAADK